MLGGGAADGGGAANGGTITDTHTATLGAEMLLLL